MRSRRWLGTRALVHEELEAIGWILDEDVCFVTRVRSYYISKLIKCLTSSVKRSRTEQFYYRSALRIRCLAKSHPPGVDRTRAPPRRPHKLPVAAR